MKKFLLGCAVLALTTAPVIAQEVIVQNAEMVAPAVQKIELNEDGSLTGNVYAKVARDETPVDAKVTLLKEGVVVDTVQTEKGSFSFANIAPGSYTLTGAGSGYSGGQAYQVGEYAGSGCSCNLPLYSTNNAAYQSSPVYNAPVYNSPVSATTSYGSGGVVSGSGGVVSGGGGGGFGGGGFGGGRLLGRRLAGRRLVRAGLIGGVVAIAVSDDDDVSAAE